MNFLTTEDTESTERLPEFLLVWSSGHEPPVSVYYHKTERGWDGTFDRDQATRFKTRRAALSQWRRLHAFPDNYEHCIHDGSVRAERYQALELNF